MADQSVVQVWLGDLRLERLRRWGACWLGCELYRTFQLDQFWRERLSRLTRIRGQGVACWLRRD